MKKFGIGLTSAESEEARKSWMKNSPVPAPRSPAWQLAAERMTTAWEKNRRLKMEKVKRTTTAWKRRNVIKDTKHPFSIFEVDELSTFVCSSNVVVRGVSVRRVLNVVSVS